jgi:hypothetical protein
MNIKKVLTILNEYDTYNKNNPDWNNIRSNIGKSVNENTPIKLLQFTCSTINPKYLYNQDNPEKYVLLNPKGNNLENDLPRLYELCKKLDSVYQTEITIFIGNTDPFYIYSQEGNIYPNISKEDLLKRYNIRWSKYRNNLEKYIRKSFPDLNFKLISWHSLDQEVKVKIGWNFERHFQLVKNKIITLFDKKDFEWELNCLKEQFGPDKYFYNIECPETKVLEQWILRKFSEYALQGFWIKTLFPTGILLQNEKPSFLRTKMYQPLIVDILNDKLPVIYPYGVDNRDYQ